MQQKVSTGPFLILCKKECVQPSLPMEEKLVMQLLDPLATSGLPHLHCTTVMKKKNCKNLEILESQKVQQSPSWLDLLNLLSNDCLCTPLQRKIMSMKFNYTGTRLAISTRIVSLIFYFEDKVKNLKLLSL
jgi:hypothetical protein